MRLVLTRAHSAAVLQGAPGPRTAATSAATSDAPRSSSAKLPSCGAHHTFRLLISSWFHAASASCRIVGHKERRIWASTFSEQNIACIA